MTDPKLATKVDEATVHTMAENLAMYVYRNYGLRLKHVQFDWTVSTTIEGRDISLLRAVEVVTERSI